MENNNSVPDVLDGAILRREFSSILYASDISMLRGADLSGAVLGLFPNDLSGIKLNNADLSEADLRSVDLSGADLADANLSGADLSDGYLSGANLSNANLTGCRLSNATVTDAQLAEAKFEYSIPNDKEVSPSDIVPKANLSGADLSDASLKDADLYEANLSGADVGNANLTGAHLRNADLTGISSIERPDRPEEHLSTATLTDATLIDANLENAGLSWADLSGADLSSAELSDALLISANLENANLSLANVENATLSSANLENADLSSATLDNANLRDVNVQNSTLSSATFENTNLRDVDLTEITDDDLAGANLCGADLKGATLIDVNLIGANLSRANLEQATLIGTNLFDTTLTNITPYGARVEAVRINDGTEFHTNKSDYKSWYQREEGILTPPPRCGYDPKTNHLTHDDQPDGKPKESEEQSFRDRVEEIQEQRDEHTTGPDDDFSREELLTRAADTYRQFEELARQNTQPTLQNSMYVLRQDMQRLRHRERGEYTQWFANRVFRVVFKHGESFARILLTAFVIIVVFAGGYWQGDLILENPDTENAQFINDPGSALYFSTLTFTTLGLGDFQPAAASAIGRGLVLFQAVLGATLIATFVFVLGRRAAR